MKENSPKTVSQPGRLVYNNRNGATTFPLTAVRATVGSDEENDIVIKRPKVSRVHAQIDFDGQRWIVTDQDSVVGTLVNEKPISQASLVDGDTIAIGAAMLHFELAAAPVNNGNGPKKELAGNEALGAEEDGFSDDEAVLPVDGDYVEVENEPKAGFSGINDEPVAALVEVQPNGSRRPFFLVAAGYNDVEQYTNLANQLSEKQPLYVLQTPRVVGARQPAETITLLAAHYIEIMRAVQGDGPFQVGGYSVGGIVAYEIAQQLLNAGDSVVSLILIDTPYPTGNALPSLSYRNAQALSQFNRRLLAPFADLGKTKLGRQLATPWQELGEKLEPIRSSQMTRLEGDHIALQAALSDRGFETNLALTQCYQPGPYPARVVLILAEKSPVRYGPTLREWSSKIRNGLDVRLIPGTFASILHEPELQKLARQITSSLEGGAERGDGSH